MRRLVLIFLALMCFMAQPVHAHWDDDAYVASQRIELQDWQNKLELDCFIACDDGVITFKVDKNGAVKFGGCCEDIAFSQRSRASFIL